MTKSSKSELLDSVSDAALLLSVVFMVGRGSRGKTLALRWLADWLSVAGVDTIIADGDRTNASLRAFYVNADSPSDPDDATVKQWLYEHFEGLAKRKRSTCLLVDFGGGDQALKQIAFDLELNALLRDDLNLRPVVIHAVGCDIDDFAYVNSLEHDGLFAPERTAILVNEALVPPHLSFEKVYSSCMAMPAAVTIQARGGQVLIMPPLACAHEVNDRRLRFQDAIAGHGLKPLGPVNRRMVKKWHEKMELALAPLLDWLTKP